jgi:LCP family protein required for cell wall assembly
MSDASTPRDGSSSDHSSGLPDASDPAPESTSSSSSPGRAADSTGGRRVAGRRKAQKQKNVVRKHWLLASFALVLALLAGTAGSYLWYLNHQIGNIDRVDAGIKEVPGQKDNSKPLNILLLGADAGDTQTESVAEDMKDGKWTPFEHRSDTMMIAHIPADRKSVQLISIPRDTWVKIDGYPYSNGYGKINGAFAYGGPSLARQTVEQLTGIHIDHLAIIDWAGFKDLTTALGGIRVYIPETFYDDSQRITWEKGWHDFEGQEALAYVRTRHGLANGDFDRIKRQQNFLRATMSKLLSGGTTRNPIKLGKVVGVITRYLTVDDTWSNGEIRDLALSMRNIHTDDVSFLTAPFGSYDTSADGQSIVRLAPAKSKALFAAVEDDDIQRYLEKYPKSALGNQTSIN